MKQVKFRAWEKKFKEMIEVYDIDFAGGIINFNTAWRGLEEVELMQYTGLKDKNGKERYFDDIVKITWRKDTDSYLQQGDDYIEKEFIARIDWHIDRIVYVLANGKKLNCPSDAQFEIIGNIYENPELLK